MGLMKSYIEDWLENHGYKLGYDWDNLPEISMMNGDCPSADENIKEPTKLDYLSVSTDGGNGVSDSMYFTFNGILTEDEAMELQEEYGYHPSGYGFYGYGVEDDVTTWHCQRSCD